MNKNFYEWPMGDFKGENVYDFPYDNDRKLYLWASIRDLKKDISYMNDGIYIIPWSKHKGKRISELSPWLQNEWKKGFKERLYHSERAFAIFYESEAYKNETFTSKDSAFSDSTREALQRIFDEKKGYKPSDVVDKYQIIDMFKEKLGFKYAKRTIDNYISQVGLKAVGTKAIAGLKGRRNTYLKEEVEKIIDNFTNTRGGESYSFFE